MRENYRLNSTNCFEDDLGFSLTADIRNLPTGVNSRARFRLSKSSFPKAVLRGLGISPIFLSIQAYIPRQPSRRKKIGIPVEEWDLGGSRRCFLQNQPVHFFSARQLRCR